MKKNSWAIAVNLAAVVVALLAFDVWRRAQPVPGMGHRIEGTSALNFYEDVDDVGYIPWPDRSATARKVLDGQAIYDVTYTIGPDSFRVAPRPAGAEACVLNFGDSNTFGEGVNDDENYPWLLGQRGGGRIASHNFGVSGWGPHQMLAGLQSGRFARALDCKPTHAVYYFIPEQVARVAGRTSWDTHGPRYALKDGRLSREGNFDTPGLAARPAPDLDEGILTWRRLLGVDAMGTPEEAELTAAVLIEAARELERLSPGTRLHVLFWKDARNPLMDSLAARLTAAGLVLHRPEAVIPGYATGWRQWVLNPLDRHPNAAAHDRVADYIAREIVGQAL